MNLGMVQISQARGAGKSDMGAGAGQVAGGYDARVSE